jgi:hypothetical protein
MRRAASIEPNHMWCRHGCVSESFLCKLHISWGLWRFGGKFYRKLRNYFSCTFCPSAWKFYLSSLCNIWPLMSFTWNTRYSCSEGKQEKIPIFAVHRLVNTDIAYVSPSSLFLLDFPTKIVCAFLISYFSLLYLITLTITDAGHKIFSYSLCNFLFPCVFIPVRSLSSFIPVQSKYNYKTSHTVGENVLKWVTGSVPRI